MSQYVADAPVFDPKEDRFNRWPFAKRIADTVAARTDPSSLVIAIYGAWGDGKTTVLNFVDSELRKLPNIVVVKFNPWHFPDEASLLRSFFITLAKTLDETLTTGKEELGKAIATYGGVLNVFWSGVGSVAQEAGTRLANVDLEEEKRRVAKILAANGKKVVVLMDDIDRLEKAEIQAIFKLVKLTADFDNTAYILSFDAEMVASAIGDKFTSIEGERLQAGQAFLEKIVQVPLDLPTVPHEALQKFCFEAINEALRSADVQISQQQGSQFMQLFCHGIEVRLKTPRMAKRYANAIMFSLAINKGEVNPVDLMLIEGIRVFCPTAYGVIKHSKEELTAARGSFDRKEAEERRLKLRRVITEGLPSEDADALFSLVQSLFPRCGTVTYGSDCDEERSRFQRVGSSQYFDRYFTYSVPDTDVADRDIAGLLSRLESSTVEGNESGLKVVINPANVGSVVEKLRTKAKQLAPTSASNLAIAVARSGALFPDSEEFLFYTQPFIQACILVSDLVRQLPHSERYKLAEELLHQAEPLRFAVEVVRRIASGKDTKPEDRILSEEEDAALWSKLAERISCYVLTAETPLVVSQPKNTARLLSVWAEHGGEADVRQYLTKVFAVVPEGVILFIGAFLPTVYSATGSSIADFDSDTYNTVSRLIDTSVVHDCIIKLFGDKVSSPVFRGSSDRPLDLTIAHQFEYVHKAVLADARKPEKAAVNNALDAATTEKKE